MLWQKREPILFYLLLLLLPTQLGKHFWPEFAFISGVRIDYLSPTLFVTDIVIAFLFFSWLGNHWKLQKAKFTKSRVLFILFVLYLLFTIVISSHVLNGLFHLLKLLECSFVAYYVATTIHTKEQVKKIFFWLGIAVIFESLIAIGQFFNQGSLNGLFYLLGERFFTGATVGIANASIAGELVLRPYGTFPHPNVLAGFLLIVLTGLLWLFRLQKTKLEQSVWIGALLLGSSALLLTMSRAAFLLWCIILVATLIQQRQKILLGIIGLLTLLSLLITPLGARLLASSFTENAFLERKLLLQESIAMFAQSPLFGVGLGNFLPMLPQVLENTSRLFLLQPVHNIFLLVLTEIGIIGFFFFIWFLFALYRFLQTARSPKSLRKLFGLLLLLILLLGLVDHYFLTLQQGQLLFALVIGLCLSKIRKD